MVAVLLGDEAPTRNTDRSLFKTLPLSRAQIQCLNMGAVFNQTFYQQLAVLFSLTWELSTRLQVPFADLAFQRVLNRRPCHHCAHCRDRREGSVVPRPAGTGSEARESVHFHRSPASREGLRAEKPTLGPST